MELMENVHTPRIQGTDQDRSSTSDEESDDGAVSTPEVDLMKWTLGDSYNGHNRVPKKEKNPEKIEFSSEGDVRKRLTIESKKKGGAEGKGSSWVADVEEPRFRDFGGMEETLKKLVKKVLVPFCHPQLPRRLSVEPITGVLLHGPPGCGKTTLAHAIANETRVPYFIVNAYNTGASEENIRELFMKAQRTASKRGNSHRGMERRIVTQLMTCMDECHRLVKPTRENSESKYPYGTQGYVLVIGATNRPDDMDPALRRPGRFAKEIPGLRQVLLELIWSPLLTKLVPLQMARNTDERESKLSANFEDEELSEELWKESWPPEDVENLSITMADLEEAISMVQPSSTRVGFSDIPDVKWEDVGGLDLLRQEFDKYIIRPIKYPEEYEEFEVKLETGFLLYKPPGCGKTLIAKAVANEAGANFIHIKVNALTTKRGKEGGWVVERLVNLLLVELDGADQRQGVFVIGATNRPDVIDNALLRSGRFCKHLYVLLPSPGERGLILKALMKNHPVDATVDLNAVGRMEACDNFSGADLAALANEAAVIAGADKTNCTRTIKMTHFELAQKQYYQKLSQSFRAV
ncbi:Spastin [Trema orientale]|uniref:Spastin n=1 Tax=Trema orientale TaxID=63057 RepID=A0A2P5EEW2_TREOI|nr:Spastin [Trema orientale]